VDKNNEIKSGLIEEFVQLGGNYKNAKKAEALDKKVNKYLKNINENDPQISDISKTLKAYKNFRLKDPEASYKIVSPVIERLLRTSSTKWILEDAKIAQIAIIWTKNFREADMLAKKTIAVLKRFKDYKLAYQIELSVYLNMTERMFIADNKEVDAGIDPESSLEVEKIFRENASLAVAICNSIGEKLKKYEILVKIREATFSKECEKADKLIEELKKIDEIELYKAMKYSVAFYSIGENFYMTKDQFNLLCGKHMREKREELGIPTKDLAKAVGLTAEHITTLERGESPFDSYILFKIADRFSITMDEFLKGIKVEKFDTKEDEAIANLVKEIKGMGETLINNFTDTAKNIKDKVSVTKKIAEKRQHLRDVFEDEE